MDYQYYGQRELIQLIRVLEEELARAFEKQGMTRSDAQSAVEAIVLKAN